MYEHIQLNPHPTANTGATVVIEVTEGKTSGPTHTHPFNGPFPGLPRWATTRKVKPIWILLKQVTVSVSGISWAVWRKTTSQHSQTVSEFLPHKRHSPNRLLDVTNLLQHCWLGARNSIRPVKIDRWGVGVVICREQGADCLHMVQLTSLPSQNPIPRLNPDWFYLSGTGLPRLSWKRGR